MAPAKFACGEFSPGKKIILTPRPPKPVGPIYIVLPPTIIPVPVKGPGIPTEPREYWACICHQSSQGACDSRSRECKLTTQIPVGVPRSISFLSRRACEDTGFGLNPCWIETWKCREDRYDCPPNFKTPFKFLRTCISCGKMKNVTLDCPHESRNACEPVCRSTDCVPNDSPTPGRVPEGPITPGARPVPVLGPITPTTYYGCIEKGVELCSDGVTIKKRKYSCEYSTTPGAPYIYTNLRDCKQNCGDIIYRCPDPQIGEGPITPGRTESPQPILGPIDPPRLPTPQPINFIEPRLPTPGLFTERILPRPTNPTNELFLDDYLPKEEVFNEASGNPVYHPVYNIFNYQGKIGEEFVINNSYLDIFADYIPKEIVYLIEYANTEIEWHEKEFLGLTKEKLIKGINPYLLQAFKQIKDIDGQLIPIDYFIGIIMRHLLYGTLDQFDASYYLNLANSQKDIIPTVIKGSLDIESRKQAILGFLSENSSPSDKEFYQDSQKIEIARQRFLLTDIEAKVYIEDLSGEPEPIFFEDPGLLYDFSGVPDYIEQGDGDGYYLTIETDDGDIPLELVTELSSTYFQSPEIRKLALNSLNESHVATLIASSIFEDSELSAGFSATHSISPLYFALDLSSLSQTNSIDSFVESITCSYMLLTNEDEIIEHSKNNGAKVSILNLPYDDLFFPYAASSGNFSYTHKDITFRNFTPSRSSTSYSILARNLPMGFILYPVSGSADNPLYGGSQLEQFDAIVTRSLKITPHFGLDLQQLTRAGIQEKLLYNEEGVYQYGLVGIVDTQNVIYKYDSSQFPNSFDVSSRSVIGNVTYNLIENLLKQKFEFDYLTWWDIYRRLPLTEFIKFVYSTPIQLLEALALGWQDVVVKEVLNREGAYLTNLTEMNSTIEDQIYLTGDNRA